MTHDVGSGGVASATKEFDEDEAAEMLLSVVADDMSDNIVDI